MNNKKVLIFGDTDLAENLFYHLVNENVYIDGFCVNEEYYKQETLFGKPIFTFEELDEKFSDFQVELYLCIGYKGMNQYRKEIFSKAKQKGYIIRNYIHSSARIYTVDIGEGNLFFENTYVGMYTKIGNGNIFYPGSIVAHHTEVGDFNFFAIASSIAGKVKLGNQNFFGNNSTTRDNINIGNCVLVGAGAYLYCGIDDGKVVVPNRSIILENKNSRDFL